MESKNMNETLYVNNLNDKIHHLELKTNLFFLFMPFGEIQEIIVKKNKNMKGQAFIIYKTTVASSIALKTLQGFNFLGKQLKIDYARKPSILLKRINGETIPVKKQPFRRNPNLVISQAEQDEVQKKQKLEEIQEEKEQSVGSENEQDDNQDNKQSNVLLAKELPSYITQEMLVTLFSQYPGFKDQRLIPEKQIAIIEFETIENATTAYYGLFNFQLDEKSYLNISFAKF